MHKKLGLRTQTRTSRQIWDENQERGLLNIQSNYSLETTASERDPFAEFCEVPNDHLAVM